MNQLKSHENVSENHNYCYVKAPEALNKTLKFNQNHKSTKIPFVIYADTKSLLEKISSYDNDPTKSFTSTINRR